MKKLKIIIAALIFTGGITGCSSAYYQADVSTFDDLYATHDKTAIAHKQRAAAEARKAEAAARQAEWEARLAEAQAQAAQDDYEGTYQDEGLVADSYESAYARRLNGFRSPSYRMPSSYYELRYTNPSQLNFALSYNPDFYNVMISGDQVWVEPKYITSMFGSWGASSYTNNWYVGWGYTPSYAWWGYPRYSWWDWNWSMCYDPWHYNPCWGHHYPHYPSWGGGSHRPVPHPNIVRRPNYTSPSSGRHFGSSGITSSPSSGTSYNRGNTTFGVRGSQGSNSGRSSAPSYQRGSSSTTNNSGTRNNRGGTTSFNRGSNSSTNNSSSYNRGSSNNTNNSNSSFNRNSSSSYGGSSGGSYGSGHSSGSGSVSGRNAGGR